MIVRSSDFNLGNDHTRMKDPRDGKRQAATVDELLKRFFRDEYEERVPLQILADEVGMGKTFVALATAFSILKAMREKNGDEDLRGCYQRILIITPANEALFSKWNNEVGEFVQRCVVRDKEEAKRWFAPTKVRRIDKLSEELRKPGTGPRVFVTTMGMFAGAKITDYDLKRRFLLSALFRYWGNRFRNEQRANLLKGAPEGWPADPADLPYFYEDEWDRLPFKPDEVIKALEDLEKVSSDNKNVPSIEGLLEECRLIAEPYYRNRDQSFAKVEQSLAELYKAVAAQLIQKDFPLVIVDEAHNWKNGPTCGANGYWYFRQFIAPHTRRALLLTATPFQLRPEEMVEILKVSDALMPAPLKQTADVVRQRTALARDKVILPTLKSSETASKTFIKTWMKLTPDTQPTILEHAWSSEMSTHARQLLHRAALRDGKIAPSRLMNIVEKTQKHVDPEIRQFMRAALELYAYNADLSIELGQYVIRHRRHTEHRLFRIGGELVARAADISRRPDSHLLHAYAGLDVRGDGELPHYLLMRCVSEMKRMKGRRGRSSLGSTLTGCYSTLLESSEGKAIQRLLGGSPLAQSYLNLLMSMVERNEDSTHPKVVPVAEHVLDNWRRGEKTLIFCFRLNTADRLRDIIEERISRELKTRAKSCLGGEDKLKSLRSRLTSRVRDLAPVGLDRALWSLAWYSRFARRARALNPNSLKLRDEDLVELARLSLLYEVPLTGDQVDRVFLNRATEHVLAKRLLPLTTDDQMKVILNSMTRYEWIERPYGLDGRSDADKPLGEAAEFDEKGVHGAYPRRKEQLDEARVEEVALELRNTRARALQTRQIPILDAYCSGPNLLLGATPDATFRDHSDTSIPLEEIHHRLWSLTLDRNGRLNWESRRKIMQSIRRAVLRESVLVRLLPERVELEESSWGELLVTAFLKPLRGQRESMAGRIAAFLEDLDAASGDLSASDPDQQGMRYAFYDSTRITDQFVSLIKGGGGSKNLEHRNRIFTGFNTPLLPEVLICTSVGQEGIDLHRHCRHVIHYDLAWNPAVLEQRTGRADRIGSKTFRERELHAEEDKPRLEVSVPFLAGTYDERMFEELRIRAQTFEVLTGGDFAADNPEGIDTEKGSEGSEVGIKLVPLPAVMVADLRVNLHVWREKAASAIPNVKN